ncbi:MAG: hypothetical protein U0271_42975 [Polyangiaceae bacterium]
MKKVLATVSMLGLLSLTAVGCTDGSPTTGDEQDLTSVRGQSRELRFEGRVYVTPGSSDSQILDVVHRQTKTAFGPLRTIGIGVNNRELKGVDPATFIKREVTVIDTDKAGDTGKKMLEVRYTYVDDAVVPTELESRSSVPLALLRPDYTAEKDRILKECTANDQEARDFADALWYVFEPSRSACQKAIQAEQKKVDAARAKLKDSATQVAKLESNRLYLPITAALGADKTNEGKSYPEYDRLYKGGVQPGKLVISLINGLIDHGEGGSLAEDPGYGEWLDTLDQVMSEYPAFTLVGAESGEDLTHFTLASGKAVTLSFPEAISLHAGTRPAGLTYAEGTELEGLFAERVADQWVTFALPRKVKIGKTGKTKAFTVELTTFFGHAETTTPFKHAIKNSDVFLYNGHSLIGFGPLDPRNFTASDFPTSYQILFIDSCVSYNYYEADYIPLKSGGTKNLDLITNAVESPSYQSGYALGQFVNTLINGKQASYLDLLQAAEATGDGMRVVDGELDNTYDPAKKPIKVTAP